MRGPFYSMISREGSRQDNFVTCTTNDLIDSANAELMKILVLGKPRSGKTTLAKALAEKLDLVRISPDLWIEELFARIKFLEENPPEGLEDTEVEDPEVNAEEEPKKEEEEEEDPENPDEKKPAEPELDADGNPIPV